MLILGAKGFAKEVLEVELEEVSKQIYFYDDVTEDIGDYLYDKFPILKNEGEVEKLFLKDNKFILGMGNPNIREQLYNKFK